jgi:two-component system response regulator AtoC
MDSIVFSPTENVLRLPTLGTEFKSTPIQRSGRDPAASRFGLLYGASAPMQRVYRLIEKVARTDATVFVIGESGSGKELVANTVHQFSLRAQRPFVAINCGAIPANLIEAELFGHERGAFTGAVRSHKGLFERAAGGTLFLDEITEMAPEMQVRLLRVLETGKFTRVGGDAEVPADVRVIAATNRDPAEAVADGRLREDLMYRLAVFPIELPPLRVRGDDVELLARHFLDELNEASGTAKTFSDAGIAALYSRAWPGHVRELRNAVQRAFILADEVIGAEHLAIIPRATAPVCDGERLQFAVGTSLAVMERHTIFATLEHCGGNKKRAAEVLGVSLKTLYNRLTEYGSEQRISEIQSAAA